MIYLDNAATTKPSNSALEKAQIFNSENFFNPSALYVGGLNCAREIKAAKENILKNLHATNHEVVFTSCGSESDNLAIFSLKRGSFLTDKGEHSAVYQSFLELKRRGHTVNFINLNSDGTVNETELYDFVKNNQVDFVSIVHVNNETGGINDVNKIARTVKTLNKNIIFHVDGVQAYGKIPFSLSKEIDLYSISAHKINALKGVGALIKRKNLNVPPMIFGGGQENGIRSGTENLFGIKVFDYAGQEKYSNLLENYNRANKLNQLFREKLDKNLFTFISSENCSPYIFTVSAKGVRGEIVMHALEKEGVIVGNGSACSSKNRFSRVIENCGYDNLTLDGVIRISFSTDSTEEECLTAIQLINSTVEKLKGKLG